MTRMDIEAGIDRPSDRASASRLRLSPALAWVPVGCEASACSAQDWDKLPRRCIRSPTEAMVVVDVVFELDLSICIVYPMIENYSLQKRFFVLAQTRTQFSFLNSFFYILLFFFWGRYTPRFCSTVCSPLRHTHVSSYTSDGCWYWCEGLQIYSSTSTTERCRPVLFRRTCNRRVRILDFRNINRHFGGLAR